MSAAQDLLSQYSSAPYDDAALLKADQASSMPGQDEIDKAAYAGQLAKSSGVPLVATGTTTGNPDVDNAIAAAAEGRYSADASRGYRDTGTVIQDHAVDLLNGAAQGIIGVAGLGAGIINNQAGVSVAGFGEAVNSLAAGAQSNALNVARRMQSQRNELTQARNVDLQTQDLAAGDSTVMAGLKRVGRDVIDSTHNGNGLTAASGIVQGIGGLIPAGVIGKGLMAIGLGEKAAMGIALGSQLGGGAHAAAVNTVMAMSQADLAANSQMYRDYLTHMSPQDAQVAVANHAGLIAAAVAAPVGVATGALFSAGEHSLFTVGNSAERTLADGTIPAVIDEAGNIVPHTLPHSTPQLLGKPLVQGGEAAVQSAAGQIGQNLGIEQTANDNQDLLQDVGDQTAQGGIAGLGMGAVLTGPSIAGRLVGIAGAKAFKGVMAAGDKVRETALARSSNVMDGLEQKSPIARDQVQPVFNATVDTMADPTTRLNIQNAAIAASSTPEIAHSVMDHFDRVAAALEIHPDEVAAQKSPAIAEILSNSTNRFDAIVKVASIANDESRPLPDRVMAGMFLAENQNKDHSLGTSLHEALANTSATDELIHPMTQMQNTLSSLTRMPEVIKAMDMGSKLAAKIEAKSVDAAEIRTHDGVAAAHALIAAAHIDPLSINPEAARGVLQHAKAAGIDLSERNVHDLTLAARLRDVVAHHEAMYEAGGLNAGKKMDVVSRNIRSDSANGERYLSAGQHVRNITESMNNGDVQGARSRLSNFMMFAQHMQNKVDAVNRHLDSKNPGGEYYNSLTGARNFEQSSTRLAIHPESQGSVEFAQRLALDAHAVTSLADVMALHYKELGLSPSGHMELDSRLQGKAEDVAKAHETARLEGRTLTKEEAPLPLKPIEKAGPEATPELAPETEPGDPQHPETIKPGDLGLAPTEGDPFGGKIPGENISTSDKQIATDKTSDTKQSADEIRKDFINRAKEVLKPQPDLSKGEDMGRKIRELDNVGKDEWIKLSEETAKLSPEEHAVALENAHDSMNNVKPATGNISDRVKQSIDEVSKIIGTDLTSLVKDIFVYDAEPGESASYNYIGNSLSMSREFLKTLGANPDDLQRVIAHELGHALDWYSSEDSLASASDEFAKDGELFKEFSKLKDLEVLPEDASSPLWNYINNSWKTGNEEFFAELHAFVSLNAEAAKELIPHGAKIITDITNEVAAARGLTAHDRIARAADEGTRSSSPTESKTTETAKRDTSSDRVSERPDTNAKAPNKPIEKLVEAKVEPVSEPVVEPVAEAKATPTDPLADLVTHPDSAPTNWFKKSFSLVPDASRVIGLGAEMIQKVTAALKTTAAFKRFAGEKSLNGNLTPDVTTAYSKILSSAGNIIENMNNRLNSNLDKTVGKSGSPTFRDALLNGGTERTVNDMMRTKVFNILDKVGDELKYNPDLQHSAVLAGLQWIIGHNQSGRLLDDQGAMRLLGIRDESQLAGDIEDIKARFNQGVDEKFAVRELGQTISRFWGTKENPNAYIGLSDGITHATAAEVLAGMEKHGLIERYQEKVQLIENGKIVDRPFNRIRIVGDTKLTPEEYSGLSSAEKANYNDARKTLSDARSKPDLLERLVLTKPEVVWHIGEPPASISERQMRNKSVKNTQQQLDTIDHHQNTPYLLNTMMHEFFGALGDTLAKSLFGSDLIDENTNINHANSIDGKNLSITSALETSREMVKALQSYADANNMKVEDVPLHYAFNIARSGRLQMDGKNNPQGSKVMRELMLPTRNKVDLRDTTGKSYSTFMLGVAQHLGEKVHRVSRATTISNIEAKLSEGGKFEPALKLVHEWLGRKDSTRPMEFTRDHVQTLIDTLGAEAAPGAIHALIEYARYLDAKATSPEAAAHFQTHLYVEADGVTDGPINALALLGLSRSDKGGVLPWFTPQWVENMAKGGMSIGAKRTSISDYMQSDAENASADLYEKTTQAFRKLRQDLISKQTPEVQNMSKHLINLMTELTGKDIYIENGKLVIERGIAKNPLTVTIYGSGARGIASKFTRLLTTEIYRQMSEGGLNKKTQDAIAALTQNEIVRDKGAGQLHLLEGRSTDTFDVKNNDPTTATMTSEMTKNLTKNITALFVHPLQDAIDHTIGEVFPAMDALRKATQVQSIFQADLHTKLVDQLLTEKAKDPKWNKSYGLTRGEINKINAEVQKLAPQISTGTQNFYVAGSDAQSFRNADVSHGLEDDFRSPMTIMAPSDAGVRGPSTLIQGAGDAHVIDTYSTSEAPKKFVPVFDGMNMGVNDIEEGSQGLNKAVYDNWLNNPLGAVKDSFGKFMDNVTPEMIKGLTENSLKDLARAFDTGSNKSDLTEQMTNLHNELTTMSDHVDARHEALSQVAMSVDHMASAESPHVSEGLDIVGSPAEQAEHLNTLLKDVLDKRGQPLDIPKRSMINVGDDDPTNATHALEEDVSQYQSANYGSDDRLNRIQNDYRQKIVQHLTPYDGPELIYERTKADTAALNATEVAYRMEAFGFDMNAQQQSTFHLIVQALAMEVHLDPNSLARMDDLWQHVTANLKPKDFQLNPENPDEHDVWQSQQKLNALLGEYGHNLDDQNRSSLLPAFLGLAMVHDEFRAVLDKLPLPKLDLSDGKTFNDKVDNFGTKTMDKLENAMSGEGKTKNVREAMDALSDRVSKITAGQQDYIEQVSSAIGNPIAKADAWIVKQANILANAAGEKIKTLKETAEHPLYKLGLAAADALTGIVNEDRADMLSTSLMESLARSKVDKTIFAFFNELVGRTKSNASIYDMIKTSRTFIENVRDKFREQLPHTIAKQFDRRMEKSEWTAMHDAYAKTDAASLKGILSHAEIMDLFADRNNVAPVLARQEGLVRQLAGKDWSLIEAKTRELAKHMNTGIKDSGNFLSNPEQIARLFGEKTSSQDLNPSEHYVKAIDQLATLYAIDSLHDNLKTTMEELHKTQEHGLSRVLSSLIGQRAGEHEKLAQAPLAKLNYYKGHTPGIQTPGIGLIVAKDSEYGQLKFRGYTRVGDYVGSKAEGVSEPKGYYYATMTGKASMHEGIMQRVRPTAYGSDPLTGYTMDKMIAGRVTDPVLVEAIQRRQRLNTGLREPLTPVFDANGKVTAYERSVDPNQEAKLQLETQLHKVIGHWRGRQMEEVLGNQINESLIKELHNVYQLGVKDHKTDTFVDLFSAETRKDPVYADAVKSMTPQARAQIEKYFGEGKFFVRRDMIDDTIGYRAASIVDPWNGTSRMPDKVQEMMKAVAINVFGEKAFQYLKTSERMFQNLVSDARTTIIMRSLIVPLSNLLSDAVHMVANGMSLKDITTGIAKKTAEVQTFMKNRALQGELEAERFDAVANNDTSKIRSIDARLRSIDDANRRTSFWKLVEAGQFSAITEDAVHPEDKVLAAGKLTHYMDAAFDKMPDPFKTAGKYAIVSNDTSLFKAMSKSVMYGEFLVKAVMFDHLTKKMAQSDEEAMGRISEEFINFERLPGRARTYAESMGLMWFYHFKIRSVKVAMRTIRNNPLRALLTTMVPMPHMFGSLGTPVTDNLAAMAYEGKVGNSLGPAGIMRAYQMLPGYHIFH